MKVRETFKQFRIDVIDTTVFISSKSFNFSYTAANDIIKPEFRNKFRYFGGLQSGFEENTPEYRQLEGWLCDLAESTLIQIKAIKAVE